MTDDSNDRTLSTSTTLIGKLTNPDDNDSWQQFLRKYRAVLFALARKNGLTEDEAGDAVQETLIAVANNISKFTQSTPRAFRPWLFTIAKRKCINQLRKRLPFQSGTRAPADPERTATIDRVPNPTSRGFEAHLDKQDREHITDLALEKLRATVSAKHFQIYRAYAVKGWQIEKVVSAFDTSVANVHKIHERLKKKLQHELSRLDKLG